MRTQPGRLSEHRLPPSSLNEKGFIATAIGVVLLISPYLLKGSAAVNAVIAQIQPLGWVALALGLLLMGLHMLRQRRQATMPLEDEAPASRFQHSVLPEELLNPPTRIRLEPMAEPDDAWGSPTDPPSTIPSTLGGPSTMPSTLDPLSAPATRVRATAWGPEVYGHIEWRRFETVCLALFTQAGFQPRAQPLGAGGGVDLWLHSRHAQGPVALARCRHWLERPVGLRELKDFQGKLAAHQLRRGSYVTSGGYTREALEFAHREGINLLDGQALLALIAKRRPEQQQALLDAAYEGEYWRPTCANCGTKMVERESGAEGSYWGCMSYPRCRHMLPMAQTG
ncbi:MAG: restriction endonuclease [Hylemonella sp.]|uniref:restriction endonuclease n=1 Tax=Hylemonella sp. TaxID=2066020 RepID=UPI0022BF0132|nr:restriction endonuclease [Hylemonella sp.]MCZ8252184.1 restriction endonuclease [Hylemonella sp.]